MGDDDTVVVYGVGGLGSHAVQLASKIFKAKRVIAVDISEGKLEIAARMGASEVVNANSVDPVERIKEITEGRLADVVLDYVGQRKTIENAIRFIGMGGRVVLVGVSPDEIQLSPYKTIIGKEMALIGSDDHLKSELSKLIELIESRKLDLSTSITHKVRLEDVNDGMQIVEGNIGNSICVVVVK